MNTSIIAPIIAPIIVANLDEWALATHWPGSRRFDHRVVDWSMHQRQDRQMIIRAVRHAKTFSACLNGRGVTTQNIERPMPHEVDVFEYIERFHDLVARANTEPEKTL